MDRKKFQKWFNDGYGKLPPERQLEELKILKEYIDEFFNEKYNSFEKRQLRCKSCKQYSFKSKYKKNRRIVTQKETNLTSKEYRIAKYNTLYYVCPKCGINFIVDEEFIGYEE